MMEIEPSHLEQLTAAMPPQRSTRAIVATLVGTAFCGAGAGLALAWALAPGSAVAQFVGFLALPLVLGLGYQMWQARVMALFMKRLGWGFLAAIWQALVLRRRPAGEGLLPTRADAAALVSQMLRATSAFAHAGLAVGTVAAPVFGAASGSFVPATLIFFVACAGFGRVCLQLARRGYLPPPEGG
jgi:hypothetical protein